MLCCGSTKILFPVIIYKKKTFKKDIQNKKMSTILSILIRKYLISNFIYIQLENCWYVIGISTGSDFNFYKSKIAEKSSASINHTRTLITSELLTVKFYTPGRRGNLIARFTALFEEEQSIRRQGLAVYHYQSLPIICSWSLPSSPVSIVISYRHLTRVRGYNQT